MSPEGHSRTLWTTQDTRTGLLVTQVRRIPRFILDHRALTSAAAGPEMEGGRGARVAVPTDHVGATLALAAVWVAHGAERTLRVTLALWKTRVQRRI